MKNPTRGNLHPAVGLTTPETTQCQLEKGSKREGGLGGAFPGSRRTLRAPAVSGVWGCAR